MKVSECMTREVRTIGATQSLREAAELMAELDAGVLPVGENDRLVGMITDRDIAIRAVGAGKGPEARVFDVMTRDIRYCFEDEDVEHVAHNMGELQVRRLPVLSRDKRLTGIVTIGDLACAGPRPQVVGEALGEISRAPSRH